MDKSDDPTTAAPMTTTQVELPNWLIPQPTMTSVELARLKRENLHTSYESAFDGILTYMVENHTSFSEAVRDDPREFDPGHYLAWVMRDENRKSKYYEAQAVTAEHVAQDLLRIADADDSFEDVARSTLKINTRKWLLGVWNRKRFGETRQLDVGVTVDLGEAMAQAQARALSRDVIDVTPREIER
jgi:hypothetical protein